MRKLLLRKASALDEFLRERRYAFLQHDYDLANQAGAAYRADSNLALGAIVTRNSGLTAPATMFAHMWWCDTTTGINKTRNSGNSAWVDRWMQDSNTLITPNIGVATGTSLVLSSTAQCTTLTATTGVVTPSVGAAAATAFNLRSNATDQWQVVNAVIGDLVPFGDGVRSLGGVGNRILATMTTIVDSNVGTLTLKGAGTTALTITGANSAFAGSISRGAAPASGGAIRLSNNDSIFFRNAVNTADLNGINLDATDTGFLFNSGILTVKIAEGASTAVNIGNASGLTTIAGPLVVAGAKVRIGTNPADSGALNIPYSSGIYGRNSANGADLSLLIVQTVNSINDVVGVGLSGNGIYAKVRSGGAAPTNVDLPVGNWTVWRDTGGSTTKLYYNNGGTLQSVALA